MLSTGQFLLSGFCWKLNTSGAVLAHNSVADSDLELKRGVRGGGVGEEVDCFVLLALLAAFLPWVITQKKGERPRTMGL